jgi:predicted RNA binding protein YcfA (HicA-like mRNA interferase family)
MPRVFSSREVIRTLLTEGFVFVSQRGSHAKYRKTGADGTFTVIVPVGKRGIPMGIFRSIIRQSGLSKERFAA